MRFLGVDPSVNDVGLAFYNDEAETLKTHTFKPIRGERTTTNIAIQIVRFMQISILQGEKRPDYLVLEHPQWENSDRGHKAAAKGYTLDLAFLIGFIAGCSGLAGTKIFTPTPMEWKGNRPKTATEAQVKKKFPNLRVTDHEYDAVGLILWLRNEKLPAIAKTTGS